MCVDGIGITQDNELKLFQHRAAKILATVENLDMVTLKVRNVVSSHDATLALLTRERPSDKIILSLLIALGLLAFWWLMVYLRYRIHNTELNSHH